MQFTSHFDEYLEYLRQKGYTEESIKAKNRMLRGSLSHCSVANKKIKDLRLTDIASVIESGRTHGRYGPQKAVLTFKSYLKYLSQLGVKLPFDWRDIETPKIPSREQSYLTEIELIKLLNSVPVDTFLELRERVLLEILFSTGMRISEALSLEWEDINWGEKEAIIVSGKTGDERKIYFTNKCIRWLRRYKEYTSSFSNSNYIFINKKGEGPLDIKSAEGYLLKHQEEWDLEKHITFHSLRRTLATLLLEKQMEIQNVQLTIGWKSPRTILRYYAIANQERAKITHQKLANII
jgi:site-specific recombinase XerD